MSDNERGVMGDKERSEWIVAAAAALPIAAARCADQVAMADYNERVAHVAADIAEALLDERARRHRACVDEVVRKECVRLGRDVGKP